MLLLLGVMALVGKESLALLLAMVVLKASDGVVVMMLLTTLEMLYTNVDISGAVTEATTKPAGNNTAFR